MKEAVKKFVVLVGAHFPRQKFTGDEAREAVWLRSMGEMLGVYDDDVLMEAAETIIRTRDPEKDNTMFPKPVECIRACDAAKEKLRIRATPLLETREKVSQRIESLQLWSDDRVSLAKSLVSASPDRERAQREGWIEHLFHFCRENGRLPRREEVGEIIASHGKLIRLLDELRGRTDAVSKGLLTLGASVRKHTHDLMN